jgi:hypothetical protein
LREVVVTPQVGRKSRCKALKSFIRGRKWTPPSSAIPASLFGAKAHGEKPLLLANMSLGEGVPRSLSCTFRVALIRPSAHDSIRVATLRKIRTDGRPAGVA